MSGLAPLTYATILDWAAMKGVTMSVDEIDALMVLDAVMLSPESKRDRDNTADDDTGTAASAEPITVKATSAWPTRQGSAPLAPPLAPPVYLNG
jgi:hypothetical protein